MTEVLPLTTLNSARFDRPDILKQLNAASRQLAELKGVAAAMPNQGILISTLTLQEAKDSSEVENIVTTHDELFRDIAFSQDAGSAAVKEVTRYRLALANSIADLQIRYGDTLINGTGCGTRGRTAPYLNHALAVADNHVTILRSKNLDPAYLSLYLNSAAGQMQVEMFQRGSSGQPDLYPFEIRKLLVWDAPPELQRQLRELHNAAAKAEQESCTFHDRPTAQT